MPLCTGDGVGYAPKILDVVERRGQDAAVLVEGDARLAVLVARLACREEVLLAVLDPLERGRQLAGREHHAHVLALRQDLLPEAAAGVPHHDAHPVLGDAEQSRAEGTDLVR